MGNSGSMHNLASIDDQQFQQQYQQYQQQLYAQQQQQQQQQQQWAQSFPRPGPPPFKVLPDNAPNSKVLRNTNNGAILNSGGTLTKPNGVGVQRSKSITSTNQFPAHPNMGALRERSRTQLNMIEERETRMMNYKRFGSEPDLRGSGDENPGGNTKAPETAAEKGRNKLLKGKKKKAAPAPPPNKQGNDYDPSRFGWRSSKPSEPQPLPPKEPPPRKLRLFKTKAESKKPSTSNTLKLAAEASDAHFRKMHAPEAKKENFRVIESHPRESFRKYDEEIEKKFNRFDEIEIDRVSDDLEWKQSRTRVIPVPQFRREKSFDVSLLGSSSKKVEDYLKNRRQRAPSPVGQGRSQRYPGQETLKPIVEPPTSKNNLRKIKEETKEKMRKVSNPPASRSSGGTSFQQELLEATKRRSSKVDLKVKDKTLNDLPPIRPTPRARYAKNDSKTSTKESSKAVPKQEPVKKVEEEKVIAKPVEIEIKQEERKISNANAAPAKTFYFGMDENAEPEMVDTIMDRMQLEAIDRFAESLMKRKPVQRMNESSESALSSDVEDGMEHHHNSEIIPIDGENQGISLQLRPTLPKKQFEIPRFSPAAAWRLLAPEDDQKESAKYYHPEKVNLEPISVRNPEDSTRSEDRIERIYREPLPGFPDNKSGDSGISGDAGLPEREESPRIQNEAETTAINNAKNVGPFLSAWTPQQDLGEESSSDGEGGVTTKGDGTKLGGPRGHVFSLSLPREVHLAQLSDKGDKNTFTTNSLQKLKKTVSGAFSGSSNQDKNENFRSDNWLLSRSAPNSIDNCQRSKFTASTPSELEESSTDQVKIVSPPTNFNQHQSISITASKVPPSFGYLTGGMHMMYLPNHTIGESSDFKIDDHEEIVVEKNEDDHDSIDDSVSKCLDDDHNLEQRPYYRKNREDLQDPPGNVYREYQSKSNKKSSKNHRFTFQSTVRQIERKRIAVQLSKEAEQKEKQRLSELEAMRRVEEEFQKKRAREKAGLRQQLRMFSMEEINQCTSLPVDWSNSRAEPDGAVSSPMHSPLPGNKTKIVIRDNIERSDTDSFVDTKTPYISRIIEQKSSKMGKTMTPTHPTTEVLSEFRQTRREYKDYRGTGKPSSPIISLNSSGVSNHQKTEHPTVVCNIPPSRNNGQIGYGYGEMDYPSTDNYRRDFARGGRSINSSDSEISGFSMTGSGKQRIQQTSRF